METMERMTFEAEQNAVFARLEEIARRANLTKEEQDRYDAEWKFYMEKILF